jgi:hypothetical protein
MRVGQNPLKGLKAPAPAPVILCAITHLPAFTGYHEERLEIVQLCLETMRSRVDPGIRFETAIFDNGSHKIFREWIRDEYRPDYLFTGPNRGKAFLRTMIQRAFPLDTIIGVTDDDMYFEPNWLGPQLEILDIYPNVGSVTGYPIWGHFKMGNNKSTMQWAQANDVDIERGELMPQDWHFDHAHSVGSSLTKYLESMDGVEQVRLTYRGVSAYATSHHCQYVARAGQLENIVQWNEEAVPNEHFYDREVDRAGMLRLATTARLCWHMGNHLSEADRARIKKDGE